MAERTPSPRQRRKPKATAADTVQLVSQFWCAQAERGIARTTRARQESMLFSLAEWAYPRSLLELDRETISRWAMDLDVSPKTLSGYLSHLSTFYGWAIQTEQLVEDPTRSIERPGSAEITRWRTDGRSRSRRSTKGPLADGTREMLEAFRTAQLRRGLFVSSIDTRHRKLVMLAEWTYPRSLLDIDRETIELWLDSRSLVPRSRYSYISHAHAFYEWAIDEDLTDHDPTERIRRPKVVRMVPRPISDEDLRLALAGAPADIAAMLALGAYAGLRCKEMANLQREDLLESNDPPVLVVVAGKGGHQRVVPLHAEVMPALRRAGLPRAGYVFTRGDGSNLPLQSWAVSGRLNTYLRSLGIPSTAHGLRHWFGTNVYRASRDLRVTQELLGHASPNTTTVYVAWSAADAATAVQGLDPSS